ncbi:MAG: hypothetical protein JNJ99_10730 [Crocinitomicaceae bacterium]|nr:hypothetical protein [Crocinitomicaceae bacterium]
MKPILLSVFTFFSIASLYAQCKADSVITYRVFNGINQIASIEYLEFDQHDSLVKTTKVDFQNEKENPDYQTTVEYKKIKSTSRIIYTTSNWATERGVFKPASITAKSFSKSGKFESESNYTITEKDTFLFSEKVCFYDKNGNEISSVLVYGIPGTDKIRKHSMTVNTYDSQNKLTESKTEKWDSVSNKWTGEWKTFYSYDSTGTLSQTTTYHFKNDAWIPTERTVYGKEADKPVEWNIVQKWDCTGEKWSNQFYYVFQKNEKGQTDTEVHLTWVKKEWQIDMAYHYVYNEAGFLVQILNDQKQVMVERYCRN